MPNVQRSIREIREAKRNKLKAGSLIGITFASQEAEEIATRGFLVAKHFDGMTPSSKKGFTADDVRKASGQ